LGLLLPDTGSLDGAWGTAVNEQITSLIDSAVSGTTVLSGDGTVTLTADQGVPNQARQAVLLCTGARTATRQIFAPGQSKLYVVINLTTGGFGVTLTAFGATSSVTVPSNAAVQIAWNGTGFVAVAETTLADKTISNATFTDGYTEESVTANSGTAYTISFANGTVQFITMTGNCTFTFPTPTAGKSFSLFLKQDGTGSRLATWPGTVIWPYGITPTLTTTINKTDRFAFTADGTNWFGSVAGQSY
jgi:hypothetical protein